MSSPLPLIGSPLGATTHFRTGLSAGSRGILRCACSHGESPDVGCH